jgi:hypothetical protein
MPVFIRRYRSAEGHNSAYNFCLNIARAFRDMSHVATDTLRDDVVVDDFFAAFKGSVSFGDRALSPVEQVFRLFCQFVAALSRGTSCFLLKLRAAGFIAMGIAEVHYGRAERGMGLLSNSCAEPLFSWYYGIILILSRPVRAPYCGLGRSKSKREWLI